MEEDVNCKSKRQKSELSLSKTCYKSVTVFSFAVSFSPGVSEEQEYQIDLIQNKNGFRSVKLEKERKRKKENGAR